MLTCPRTLRSPTVLRLSDGQITDQTVVQAWDES